MRWGNSRRIVMMMTAALLALVATSCRTATGNVKVGEDMTATVTFDVVPDSATLDVLGGAAELDRIIEQYDDPSAGITAKKTNEAAGIGMRVTVVAPNLTALTRPYPLPAPAGATFQMFDKFDVVKGEDTWLLDAIARPLNQVAPFAQLNTSINDATDYRVSVQLPGRLEQSNAESVDHDVPEWNVASFNSPRELTARTAQNSGISPLLVVLLAGAALVGLGLLLAARGKDAATTVKLKKESRRFLRSKNKESPTWQSVTPERKLPSGAAASAATATSGTAGVMYAEDFEGDDSHALPVAGEGWGPAPPPGTTTGTVRPAPQQRPTSPDGATTMGPATPVRALDRGSRLGVAAEEPAAEGEPILPPGWYADPDDASRQRFWDGASWTEHRD